MIDNTSIESYSNDKSALYIQQLNDGVTKELLLKEFIKFGQLKHVRHFPETNSALIAYENAADAEGAMKNLNHTHIQCKELSITYLQDKDVLSQQKKKSKLLLKNVSPTLEPSVLHNFLESEPGNVDSLILKKKDDIKQNLGDGYIQFEKDEDYKKILQHKQNPAKMAIINTNQSFTVRENKKKKTNKIRITGLFNQEISSEEKEAIYNQIWAVFEGIKKNIGDKQRLSIHTHKNDQKKSFQTTIEFAYTDDDEEDSIYQATKESIAQNFKNTSLVGGPQITFKANESSLRNLICLGVKNGISETILASWLLRVLGIVISEQNIQIRLPNSGHKTKKFKTSSAQLSFDSKKDGENFMIFCSKANNAHVLKEIFETNHKVTLFLKHDELSKIKQQTAIKIKNQKGGISQSLFLTEKTIFPVPSVKMREQSFYPAQIHNMQFPKLIMQTGFIQSPLILVPVISPILFPKEHAKNSYQNNRKVNIFLEFQRLSPIEKKQQVEDISQKINSCKIQFNLISDEAVKRSILHQIIYYKIQNFGDSNIAELIFEFKKTPQEANSLITEFHQEIDKITDMLIDKEIFSIKEIRDIILNPRQLLYRCLKAIDLLSNSLKATHQLPQKQQY